MVKWLPGIQQPTRSCESCILAKHHKDKFIYGVSYRAKAPLEFFHTDLCGWMKMSSLIGNVYFMTFIDDFSRKTWVYLFKKKFEDFDIFNRFKFMLGKERKVYEIIEMRQRR
jgi:hypothetical protein